MKFLFTAFILLFPIALFAQTEIIGTVTDESGQAIPYATVAFYNLPDTALVTGTTTGDEGNFKSAVPPGDYFIQISFLSFEDKFMELEVGNEPVNLGTLVLSSGAENLQEVVVEQERSQMQLQLDKKVFNVGQDLSTTGANAADVLDNIPSVVVDVEGNISLRGSGNVQILINGKPSGLVSSGDPQSLRQLQGNMIERVEIITNPSAKYDAEGEVGIINIILKEQDNRGLHGSFDLSTGYPHDHGAAFNFNYRKSWINFFISEGVSWDENPGGGESFQEYFFEDTSYSYERIREQSRSDFDNNLRLGFDLYLSPNDVITATGIHQISRGNNLSTTTYRDFDENGNRVRTVVREQDEDERSKELEFDINYTKEFKKKDQVLTVDLQHSFEEDMEIADYFENNDQTGAEIDIIQRSDNLEYEKSWLFQTDYVHPFGNEGRIETGLKGHLRHFVNDYTVEEEINEDEWQPLPDYDNEFIYEENIYAAYFLAGEKFGRFSVSGGLRAEYSDIRTELVKTNETNPRQYLDIFPSIFFGYEFQGKNTLQASYSRRLSRPGYWSLVPFMQYADSRNYRSGNPDLNPEYTNSFELGYQRYLDRGNFMSSIYYRHRTGVIDRVTIVDSTGLTRMLPVNLATEDDFGLELSMSYDINEWWSANGSFNAFRAITSGSYAGQDLYSDTYIWNAQFSSKIKIAQRVDVQPSFRYRSPRKTTQGSRKASYALDLGTSTDVFNDRGTLTLSVRDILNTRQRTWITEGENFRTEGTFRWRNGRQIRLSFNYRFGRK